MISKDQLRRHARARRAECAAVLPDFAQIIAAYAAEIPLSAKASVASYWPLRDEADPRLLARALAARGHPILLPCVAAPDTALSFRVWREGEPLAKGCFAQMEPLPTAKLSVPEAILVPLLAFDGEGHRLGFGGGYYDRTLAALRQASAVMAVGIAYAGQEAASLPHDPHDAKLDMVLTETGLLHFPRG